jgi:hypothetical protein
MAEESPRAWVRAHLAGYLRLTSTVMVYPCEMRLTIKKGSNGKTLNVRCRCMAGTHADPSRRFCNYDPIGEAGSLDEAKALWRAHADSRKVTEAA